MSPLHDLKTLFPGKVSFEEKDLLFHAGDLWPRKLIIQRLGQKLILPKAIVRPESVEDIQALLTWAHQKKVGVIPYGGGSGVCGGTQVLGESVSLDLRKMNHIRELNDDSSYVTAEAGILGPDLENALNQKGFTLNHFPASFHISTLGGWISTRASGQLSTGFGSIEDLLLALKVVLPNGHVLETKLTPRSSTGPSLNHLFLGSEGTLGVIVEASLKMYRLPPEREFLSFSFQTISEALLAIRTLVQKNIFPAVIRLYDEVDTQMALSEIGLKASGNLLVLLFQGEQEIVEAQKNIAQKIFSHKGKALGEKPAQHWWEHRFDLNEKKVTQILSQEGMILDTLEVATTWNHLETLYAEMKKMIESEIIVLAHFSHFYLTGGSIYFTFVGSTEEQEALTKYDTVWDKAMEACLKVGGTISHHHGIGLLRKKWIQRELQEGWAILSQLKKGIDPYNILNPKKLL
ncbi:MAG: FAD-binding oxidoreductase [Deltaproteobacteria bacterium]|nr:FAD-binding oxidoreductase [Deltaproteobacteria bacterium]